VVDEFKLVEEMATLIGGEAPKPIQGLADKEILHRSVYEKDQIKEAVEKRLGLS